MAYLLGETELNAGRDKFLDLLRGGSAANRRARELAGGRFRTIGDTEASDPVSLDHDERAFCLLESVYGMGHLDLLDGWHVARARGLALDRKAFRHATARYGDGRR